MFGRKRAGWRYELTRTMNFKKRQSAALSGTQSFQSPSIGWVVSWIESNIAGKDWGDTVEIRFNVSQ